MGLFDFVGGAIGSILGFESERQNTAAVNEANAAQLERQIEANKETMQNRHQWEVADLKAAGINPMLSSTSPTGTLSAPSANPMQKSNSAVHLAQLGQLFMEGKKLDIERMNAKANLTNAESAKENAITNREQMLHNARQIDADVALKNTQINSMVKQLDSIIDNTKSQTRLNVANALKTELENEWLPKMREAELSQINQDIANSILITAGKISLMDAQARSALTVADAQMMLAEVARENGIQLRNLQQAQINEVNQRMGFERELFPTKKEMYASEANLKESQSHLAADEAVYADMDAKIFQDTDSIGGSMYRAGHYIGHVIGQIANIAKFSTIK